MEWAALGGFYVSCVIFSFKRLLRFLHYFQQEGYEIARFGRWLFEQRACDRRGTAILLGTYLLQVLLPFIGLLIGAVALMTQALMEENPLKQGKIKLVLTPRAKRIFGLASLLYLLAQSCFILYAPLLAQALLFQFIPTFLMAAVYLLSFDEKKRQRRFLEEAKAYLRKINPYVIGITGSYGKTSAKSALEQILKVCLGSTFATKKSINTEMGITREVRDRLKPGTEYAVIEMGAYGRGSIEKLCRLTPPQAAMITTVGVAHLDRFGSQETIRKAKAELAEAVPSEGILVCNGDNEGSLQIAREHSKQKTYLYGFQNVKHQPDCWIKEVCTTLQGTRFVFEWKGTDYPGKTAILGRLGLSNLAGCFTMACALGADPRLVIGAIANLRPVDNRLHIRKEKGIIYLQDAYNSNPEGFSDALEILNTFSSGKKVLMTPGMIELGELQREAHEKIGKKAGEICDVTLIVGDTNREALCRGLHAGGVAQENILFAKDRKEAFTLLEKTLVPGDAVLIENDLPDLYETEKRF